MLLLDIATAAHGDDVAVQVAGDNLTAQELLGCEIEAFKRNEQELEPRSS